MGKHKVGSAKVYDLEKVHTQKRVNNLSEGLAALEEAYMRIMDLRDDILQQLPENERAMAAINMCIQGCAFGEASEAVMRSMLRIEPGQPYPPQWAANIRASLEGMSARMTSAVAEHAMKSEAPESPIILPSGFQNPS